MATELISNFSFLIQEPIPCIYSGYPSIPKKRLKRFFENKEFYLGDSSSMVVKKTRLIDPVHG
jgi:hypothetical protein